jgi:hypothetical protein
MRNIYPVSPGLRNVKSHISSQNKSENLKVKIKTKHFKVKTSAGRNLGQLSCEQHKITYSESLHQSPILHKSYFGLV